MPDQPFVFVPYGKCGGLNPLTGVGQITREREIAGMRWVFVEPVEMENSIPLEKWILFEEVQYAIDLNQKTAA